MSKKSVAKRYLLIVSAMFAVFALLSFLIIFGVGNAYGSTLDMTTAQRVFLALGCAYVPCASFSGFCICFIRIKELSRRGKILLCFFNIVALAAITVVGIIGTVPYIIYSICVLIKK